LGVVLRIAARNGHGGLAIHNNPHKLVRHTSLSAMTMIKQTLRKPSLPILASFTTLLLLLFLALPTHANDRLSWDGADTMTLENVSGHFDGPFSRNISPNAYQNSGRGYVLKDQKGMPIAIVLQGEPGFLSLLDDRKPLSLLFPDPGKNKVQREVIHSQQRLMDRPH